LNLLTNLLPFYCGKVRNMENHRFPTFLWKTPSEFTTFPQYSIYLVKFICYKKREL
jgi:hypothetical protein